MNSLAPLEYSSFSTHMLCCSMNLYACGANLDGVSLNSVETIVKNVSQNILITYFEMWKSKTNWKK